jgi:hypothetical protein
MKLPLSIAEKLIMLGNGGKMPFSKLKHPIINSMLDNGILKRTVQGRSKVSIFLPNENALQAYLHNHFGIVDLGSYIVNYKKEELSRAEAIEIASNSKLRGIRTFQGFLVNCYESIKGTLNGKPIAIQPQDGTFTFIFDFKSFLPNDSITVVGIENPENFRHIEKQRHLFKGITPLFVSRYPQSKDLISWLQIIPNHYIHFGDFDFAGINIYLNGYKKHLQHKAQFYVPPNIEELIAVKGNRELYNKQQVQFDEESVEEEDIHLLLKYIRKHKKGLEQEIFAK